MHDSIAARLIHNKSISLWLSMQFMGKRQVFIENLNALVRIAIVRNASILPLSIYDLFYAKASCNIYVAR